MRSPSTAAPAVLSSLVAGLALARPVSAQPGRDAVGSTAALVGSLVGMLVVLAIGYLVVLFAPEYVERTVGEVRERSGEFFLVGLVLFFGVLVTVFVLVLTVVGIVVVLALIPVLFVVGVAAYAVVSTWVGRLLVPDGSLNLAYLVGAVVVTVVSQIPLLGGLVNFLLVTCLGGGAVVVTWYEGR